MGNTGCHFQVSLVFSDVILILVNNFYVLPVACSFAFLSFHCIPVHIPLGFYFFAVFAYICVCVCVLVCTGIMDECKDKC